MVPPIERSSPPEDHTALNVKDNSNPEEGSRGDYEREMPRNEQKPMTAEISSKCSCQSVITSDFYVIIPGIHMVKEPRHLYLLTSE